MSLLIGADLVPTESNFDLFKNGYATELIGAELVSKLGSADYRIFNLEVPLTDSISPIDKCGPNLIAPTSTIQGIKNIGVDLFTIANNHIMDQGLQGLESTIKCLETNSISFVGAGANLSEASKPYVIERKGKKIGIYACAENEFSIATAALPGANPYDPLESFDHVTDLKRVCDFVIVLYHGGKEHYRYPSPLLQKACRKFIFKGADLVICQHSHCIGCEEKYNGGTIVYGQGNFLFDYSSSEYWQTGLLVELDDSFNISYIPLCKDANKVRLASGDVGERILTDFYNRSEEIKQEGFIESSYAYFAKSMIETYLFRASAIKNSLPYRALNKLCGHKLTRWIIDYKYKKAQKLVLRNFIECEAHRELFIKGLE